MTCARPCAAIRRLPDPRDIAIILAALDIQADALMVEAIARRAADRARRPA